METLFDLPEHEIFVSAVQIAGRDITVRLVSDYHPGTEAQAFNIVAHEVENPDDVEQHLASLKKQDSYVYAWWEESSLVLAEEHGAEVVINARSFSGGQDSFNREELQEAISRVYSWYLAENELSRKLASHVSSVKDLLHEQARRVETKSASHQAGSTASVLYAQQQQFIERILRMLET